MLMSDIKGKFYETDWAMGDTNRPSRLFPDRLLDIGGEEARLGLYAAAALVQNVITT
jgi:hypothetical protein